MKLKKSIQIMELCLTFLCGCRAYLSIDKRPSLALPVIQNSTTNDYVIVDQGYVVNYSKWGFNTEIQSMGVELSTNKTVKFTLGGFNSTIVTNTFSIKIDDVFNMLKLFRDVNSTTTNEIQFLKNGEEQNIIIRGNL